MSLTAIVLALIAIAGVCWVMYILGRGGMGPLR